MAEELETLQEKLAQIQSQHPSYEELDSERLVGHKKTLTNTLGTLNQIIGTFSGCYDEEFRHWADRPAVNINDIGQFYVLCMYFELCILIFNFVFSIVSFF